MLNHSIVKVELRIIADIKYQQLYSTGGGWKS